MSRKKKFRGGPRGGGGGRRQGSTGDRTPKQDVSRENEKYCKYYDSLDLVPEEEKAAFWACMRKDLPNSFRFTGSKAHALAVQQKLKDFYIPEIVSIKHDGEFVEAPQPVEWYPLQLAWYMTVPKSVIRRFAPFASFQKFLVAENDVGNISRQEVVSMIPPLLMDVRPSMAVLDLCAAPGSKSAQLLELILAGQEERTAAVAAAAAQNSELSIPDIEDDGRSTGLLIANDVDYKRAHMLTHQLKRLSSANLIVTNHDATMFPSIKLPSESDLDGKAVPNKYLKFDRILADVPCSGDGTARKNLDVWRSWTPQNALGLHITQVRILVRALQMLKVGGRVVYSTCSMNPIEDEAVLIAAIDRCGGPEKVKLVDCSDKLPGLKRCPGMRSWHVMDRNGVQWKTYIDVEASRTVKDDIATNKLSESMFPPVDEDLKDLPLHYAMRVYPHLQDTGAFFIAVLEKLSEIKARPEHEPKRATKARSDPDPRQNIDPEGTTGTTGTGNLGSSVAPNHQASSNDTAASTLSRPPTAENRKEAMADTQESKRLKASENASNSDIHPTVAQQIIHPLPNKPMVEDVSLTRASDASGSTVPASATSEANYTSFTPLQHPLPEKPPAQLKRKKDQPFEEPFKYLSPDLAELQHIHKFYNISERFPMDRFMVRNAAGTATKNIYYTTALAKGILMENEGKGLKFVHCGVKMFVKQDVPNIDICPWRIQTDGLAILERWVGGDRIIILRKKETLKKLLIEMFPKFSGEAWKELGEVGPQILKVEHGCCVLRVEAGDGADDLQEYMVFPLWKSLHSLNLMLPKEDRKALLLRLFNDAPQLENHLLKGPSKANSVGSSNSVTVAEDSFQIKDDLNGNSPEDRPGANTSSEEE